MRILAFGDLQAEVWGFVWGTVAGLRAGGASAGPEVQIDPGWAINAEGIEISVEGCGSEAAGEHGSDQLCRVKGRVIDREVDCLGIRGERAEPASPDSLREVLAWFDSGTGTGTGAGIALSTERSRQAKHHGEDRVRAVVFEEGAGLGVADPRLSTTYDADGSVRRAGCELWLDLPEEDERSHYPRRVAGEADGDQVVMALPGGLTAELRWLRCHTHGLDGPGAYLLIR